MPGHRRSFHSFIVLLIAVLGLLATAPAGTAAQGDAEDEDTPDGIVALDEGSADGEDADEDNADQEVPDAAESGADEDVTDEDTTDQDDIDQGDAADRDTADGDGAGADPPDCDDGDWRILTTEDGTGFANEDHCERHVAAYGAASVDEPVAGVEGEYVIVTITEPSGGGGGKCWGTITLVNGQNGQAVKATVVQSGERNARFFEPVFVPDSGEISRTVMVDEGHSLVSGSAELLDPPTRNPTGEMIPIYLPSTGCRAAEDRPSEAGVDDVYVIATISEPNSAGKCRFTVTLVGGEDGQVVEAVIRDPDVFASIFLPATGETSRTILLYKGNSLKSGTAQFLDPTTWERTGEMIPVYLQSTSC